MHTIFVTGGTGCIGSVTIYKLLQYQEVGKIVIATRSNNVEPLKLWLVDYIDPRLEFVTLDVSDYKAIEEVVLKVNPTHIIHLGAYQSPDCARDHIGGMEINTGGTMALFDVAEKLPLLKKFVFASSAAVYGMRSMYSQDTINEDVQLAPPNHYGIWKLAGEHLGRLFHKKTKVPTVCLRLNTTYGKGRDKGMTSAPTNALKAVAMGAISDELIHFEMPYQGRENYHFVEDVGAQFAACTLQPYEGFGAFNIKGETIEIRKFLGIVDEQARDLGLGDYSKSTVMVDAPPNLFVCDLEHEKISRAFKNLPQTTIEQGVRKSLEEFLDMAKKGILDYSKASS
ncbi:NAD-dependent epimerase/dehydratase family protein [Maribacter sp. HTCC2170]|uniref:NAD-dependent epimerase/dehydratase family protein n=1 Tax=Maribacter sp. (strain HTCC2170 / KCCM 42371) TaxID=313603 RepID=UPI00006B47D4|nr:NAD(P)-dependent oxidoreductase [Maribacter sp. HTCC2170]EAR01770.1 NAD-dependent epimerase/dehydratase:Short-chain dehydrogenase/reductase SDR:3-beta hydroxysteroid [Maribacter sp. HTCC2170]